MHILIDLTTALANSGASAEQIVAAVHAVCNYEKKVREAKRLAHLEARRYKAMSPLYMEVANTDHFPDVGKVVYDCNESSYQGEAEEKKKSANALRQQRFKERFKKCYGINYSRLYDCNTKSVTQGVTRVTQGVTHPTESVTQSVTRVTPPAESVTQGVTHPTESVTQSVTRVTHPAESVTQGVTHPTESVTQSVTRVTHPAESVTQGVTHPTESVTQSVTQGVTHPTESVTQQNLKKEKKKIPPHTPLKEKNKKNKPYTRVYARGIPKQISTLPSTNLDLATTASEPIEAIPQPPKTPQSSRGCRLPPDFEPDLNFARQQGLTEEKICVEVEKFRDYWGAKAGKDATKVNWQSTWRNWIRRSQEYSAKGGGNGTTNNNTRQNFGQPNNHNQQQRGWGHRVAEKMLKIPTTGDMYAFLFENTPPTTVSVDEGAKANTPRTAGNLIAN
ncbi:hypothetical protein [Bartonella sp. DGB2]|uniref:hypothetical protein n=1 Tax=Bartonella sp. DGB2 TaxID=3388426 RepID=UPI00398FA6FE